MDGHPLVELAYVLYGVRSAIIHSESRLMESPRKLNPSILRVKGDLEIRSRALLMASFTRPL